MYVVGIDYGHGETSAARIEIDSELYKKISDMEKKASQPISDDVVEPFAQIVSETGTCAVSETNNSSTIACLDGDGSTDTLQPGEAEEEEWNVSRIKMLLIHSFSKQKDLKIKGDSKSVKSTLLRDGKTGEWVIGPNESKLKSSFTNLDPEQGQFPELHAYFKGPLVNGKGETNNSNSLEKIDPDDKMYFGSFIKQAYESIIDSNDLHRNPRNFRLYVACPSEWDLNQVDEYHKFLLQNGIPCEEIVQESRAAYMSYRDPINERERDDRNDKEKSGILVIDFGSSTIDFTYFDGENTVNHGYQSGAQKVERKILEHILENEDIAKEAFEKLTAAVGNQSPRAKTLLLYALRNRKEKFYDNLKENGYAELDEIPLRSLMVPPLKSGIIFTTERFGFDRGYGYNEEEIDEIIKEYREEVESCFINFKERKGVGNIHYVILTGGASKMSFVKKLAEEVYKVHKCTPEEINNGVKETLEIDDEPTFSISRGIAKYGTYRTLTEPIRNAIDNRLNLTWRNEEWLNKKLERLIKQVVPEVYSTYFSEIVDDWKQEDSLIVSKSNDNLNSIIDPICQEKLQMDPSNSIWLNIQKARPNFNAGQHSIHALLRKLYDEIELAKQSVRDIINLRINEELLKNINNQVGALLRKYIIIYIDENKENEEGKKFRPRLPSIYDIRIDFTNEQKKTLLIRMVERIFMRVDQIGEQTSNTFNKNRHGLGFYVPRSTLSPIIKDELNKFCKEEVCPYFPEGEIERISSACKNSVEKKYEEIKKICEIEPYKLRL